MSWKRTSLQTSLAGVLVGVTAVGWSGQDPQPPVFRGQVALVPVDVRVLDREGNPVADLEPEDFTILEGGLPQPIRHFAVHARGEREQPATAVGAASRLDESDLAPGQRTLLFVLGRGRLQGASRGFDGLLDFLETRVLPADRLGLVAYDRVTELTADQAAIKTLVERYRDHHAEIEALLDHWFRGLTGFYGDREFPAGAATRIDALFAGPGLPRIRALIDAPLPGEGGFEADRQRVLASLGESPDGRRRDFTFLASTRQDMEKLHGAVEYLRHVPGEKHLIFVTYEGLLEAAPGAVDRLARLAADARVTLSTIQTGGVFSRWVTHGSARILEGPTWDHRWAIQDLRVLARDTGGVASAYEFARQGLDRLDRATRLQYILGYYPQNPHAGGDFRRIVVRVNRPDVQVLHRAGYYARSEAASYDRRAIVTDARMAAAASYGGLISDIPVSASARLHAQGRDTGEVEIEVRLASDAIAFVEVEGRQTAALDVALYVGDASRRPIGELRQRIDLSLLPATYARVRETGVVFSLRIPFKGRPRHVKTVVYQHATGRVGTAVTEVRR